MKGKDAFEILQIEKTNDIKKIKKAYARLVKQYHPEDDEERWLILHEAYEQAIRYAKRNYEWYETKEKLIGRSPSYEPEDQLYRERNIGTESSNEELIEQIERMIASKRNMPKEITRQEDLEEAVRMLEVIKGRRGFFYSSWKKFFQSETYKRVCLSDQFLFALGRTIGNSTINKKKEQLIRQEVENVRIQLNDNIFKNQDGYQPDTIKYLEDKIEDAAKRFRDRGKNIYKLILFTIGMGAFCVIICIAFALIAVLLVLLIRFFIRM